MTDQPGVPLAILTADCLPVLLSNREGSVVGAAHAGWRGLAVEQPGAQRGDAALLHEQVDAGAAVGQGGVADQHGQWSIVGGPAVSRVV